MNESALKCFSNKQAEKTPKVFTFDFVFLCFLLCFPLLFLVLVFQALHPSFLLSYSFCKKVHHLFFAFQRQRRNFSAVLKMQRENFPRQKSFFFTCNRASFQLCSKFTLEKIPCKPEAYFPLFGSQNRFFAFTSKAQ